MQLGRGICCTGTPAEFGVSRSFGLHSVTKSVLKECHLIREVVCGPVSLTDSMVLVFLTDSMVLISLTDSMVLISLTDSMVLVSLTAWSCLPDRQPGPVSLTDSLVLVSLTESLVLVSLTDSLVLSP